MDDFKNTIKEWVSIDNQIRSVNDELRTLREDRNNKACFIINYANTNSMGSPTVNISDGKLKLTTSRQTAPLTLKHVEQCLKKCIVDEQQVDVVMNFIKETRPTKEISDIKRTYSSN
tara:strand:+ start:1033 stop:1383 length:351 start_codon:yes stop_codon:yes gene_type:complete